VVGSAGAVPTGIVGDEAVELLAPVIDNLELPGLESMGTTMSLMIDMMTAPKPSTWPT
jgi:hypothetical protein